VRYMLIGLSMLCIAIQALTSPNVTGFAVSTRNQGTGTFDFVWGVSGQVWRYDIVGGAVTNRVILYDGIARSACISPDGQYVAFIRRADKGAYISYMNSSGGTIYDLVDHSVIMDFGGLYIDWPLDDWIYYPRKMSDGSQQIWKVSRSTGQNVKICAFKNPSDIVWEFSVANDGDKVLIRLWDSSPSYANSDILHFSISKDVDANGTIDLMTNGLQAFAGWYDAGCGASLSPDGNYQCRYININHAVVQFTQWDQTVIDTFTYSDMSNWGGGFFGKGGNNPRWSSNDPKWICANVGWEDRAAQQGSSQVLMNFFDHQIIRTTDDGASGSTQTAWENDFGDFWVGDMPTPAIAPAQQTQLSSGISAPTGSVSVFDLLGRKLSSKQLAAARWDGKTSCSEKLLDIVCFVQYRNNGTIRTERLIVK
jgi:hypothetical protein